MTMTHHQKFKDWYPDIQVPPWIYKEWQVAPSLGVTPSFSPAKCLVDLVLCYSFCLIWSSKVFSLSVIASCCVTFCYLGSHLRNCKYFMRDYSKWAWLQTYGGWYAAVHEDRGTWPATLGAKNKSWMLFSCAWTTCQATEKLCNKFESKTGVFKAAWYHLHHCIIERNRKHRKTGTNQQGTNTVPKSAQTNSKRRFQERPIGWPAKRSKVAPIAKPGWQVYTSAHSATKPGSCCCTMAEVSKKRTAAMGDQGPIGLYRSLLNYDSRKWVKKEMNERTNEWMRTNERTNECGRINEGRQEGREGRKKGERNGGRNDMTWN